ncbi:uncharacterized protein LOC110433950 [Sorghum bicolor]|uniref:uncharacterized protein LOC110433950 n=1 Tax=Sorghum bicolor TaxID=4558 RepID=UPI000B423BB3|nr:uncharacterized protein LOC110433950 [Sorghum bicolor]|eukprot:XP_021312839.1 uncharacterized protein LOC110433950 [Sorghum bicolor]
MNWRSHRLTSAPSARPPSRSSTRSSQLVGCACSSADESENRAAHHLARRARWLRLLVHTPPRPTRLQHRRRSRARLTAAALLTARAGACRTGVLARAPTTARGRAHWSARRTELHFERPRPAPPCGDRKNGKGASGKTNLRPDRKQFKRHRKEARTTQPLSRGMAMESGSNRQRRALLCSSPQLLMKLTSREGDAAS